MMAALAADSRRTDALASYTRFAERLKAELDVTPSHETTELARKLREDRQEEPMPDSFAPKSSESTKAHALIAPFNDLGGGDLASFFANEMPSEISFRTRAINLTTLLPAGPVSAQDSQTVLDEARRHRAESIISGSARQIGSKIRIAANLTSIKESAVVWNDTLIVDESDAFEAIG